MSRKACVRNALWLMHWLAGRRGHQENSTLIVSTSKPSAAVDSALRSDATYARIRQQHGGEMTESGVLEGPVQWR